MIPLWYQTRNPDGSEIYPVDFYIERMKNNQYFSRLFLGDGEFRWMVGETELIGIYGCEAPDLLEAFRESAKIALEDENYFLATRDRKLCDNYMDGVRLPHNDSQVIFNLIEEVGLKNYKWHNGELFLNSILDGTFGPFLKQLNEMNIVLVANKELRILKEKGLKYNHFIESFQTKDWGYGQRHHIIEEILKYNKPAIYLLCCGYAATYVIAKLYKKMPGSYLIDMGRGLDFLADYRWRDYRCSSDEETKRMHEKVQSNLEAIK